MKCLSIAVLIMQEYKENEGRSCHDKEGMLLFYADCCRGGNDAYAVSLSF